MMKENVQQRHWLWITTEELMCRFAVCNFDLFLSLFLQSFILLYFILFIYLFCELGCLICWINELYLNCESVQHLGEAELQSILDANNLGRSIRGWRFGVRKPILASSTNTPTSTGSNCSNIQHLWSKDVYWRWSSCEQFCGPGFIPLNYTSLKSPYDIPWLLLFSQNLLYGLTSGWGVWSADIILTRSWKDVVVIEI